MNTSRFVITSVSALAFTAAGVLPAFAETNNVSAATMNVSSHVVTPGTVMMVHPTAAVVSGNAAVSARTGTPMSIDDRITMLQNVLARIGTLNVIPSAAQASLKVAVQAQIDKLEALKASGQTTVTPGTSGNVSGAAGAGSTVSSNAGGGVFFALVSKAAITTAADHILAVAGQLENLEVKLDARISAASNVDATSLRATLADMKAKTADAKTNANAALADVANLSADADASTSTTVAASLKDAAAKIGTARTDLATAYKDASTIVKAVHGLGTPTSASGNVSGAANAQ